MAKKDYVSELEGALNQMKKVLGLKALDFGEKARIALDMLDESLEVLVGQGLLSKVSIVITGSTDEGKHKEIKYALGKKEVEDDEGYYEEVPCIKKSVLEEDE